MKRLLWLCGFFLAEALMAGGCPREKAIKALFPELEEAVFQEICTGLTDNKRLNILLGQARAKKLDDWARQVIKLAYADNLRRQVKKTVENVPASGQLRPQNIQAFEKVSEIFSHREKTWLKDFGLFGWLEHPPEKCLIDSKTISPGCLEAYRLLADSLKSLLAQQIDLAAAHIQAGY